MVDKSEGKVSPENTDALKDIEIAEFYKLKGRYDKQYNRAKAKIMKTDASNKRKRDRLGKIKLKCVNCKRPVGMRFSTVDRILKAQCGDTSNACKLNTEITLEYKQSLDDLEELISGKMNEVKRAIMGFKLRILYGQVMDADVEDIFKELGESYDEIAGIEDSILTSLRQQHMVTVQEIGGVREITRKEYIKMNQVDLNIQVADFKALMKLHIDAVVPDIKLSTMVEAIDKYNSDIIPTLNIIRNLRYKINDVILVKGQHTLIQIVVPPIDREV